MGYIVYEQNGERKVAVKQADGLAPVGSASLIEALNSHDKPNGVRIDEAVVKVVPPVDAGAKILCVALNYVDHAKESNQPVPETPIIFFKSHEAMIAGGQDITAPQMITQLDYEGELAIIIGKSGFNIRPEDVWDHIAGVSTFNDVSARDLFKVKAGTKEHLDWFSGKCLDSSTPIGPEVVPIGDVVESLKAKNVRVKTTVNDDVRQDASIADMIFDIPTLVSFASSRVRLSPGDIIATGTPPGVGAGTGRFISKGDVVRIEITGLPPMENRVG